MQNLLNVVINITNPNFLTFLFLPQISQRHALLVIVSRRWCLTQPATATTTLPAATTLKSAQWPINGNNNHFNISSSIRHTHAAAQFVNEFAK